MAANHQGLGCLHSVCASGLLVFGQQGDVGDAVISDVWAYSLPAD